MNKADKYLKEKIDSYTKAHKGEDPEEILADMRGKNLIADAMTQEEKAKERGRT